MTNIEILAYVILFFTANHIIAQAYYYFEDNARMGKYDWKKKRFWWELAELITRLPRFLDMFFCQTVLIFDWKQDIERMKRVDSAVDLFKSYKKYRSVEERKNEEEKSAADFYFKLLDGSVHRMEKQFDRNIWDEETGE